MLPSPVAHLSRSPVSPVSPDALIHLIELIEVSCPHHRHGLTVIRDRCATGAATGVEPVSDGCDGLNTTTRARDRRSVGQIVQSPRVGPFNPSHPY